MEMARVILVSSGIVQDSGRLRGLPGITSGPRSISRLPGITMETGRMISRSSGEIPVSGP